MAAGHFLVNGLGVTNPVTLACWRLAKVLCKAGSADTPKCCLSEPSALKRREKACSLSVCPSIFLLPVALDSKVEGEGGRISFGKGVSPPPFAFHTPSHYPDSCLRGFEAGKVKVSLPRFSGGEEHCVIFLGSTLDP